MDPTPSLWTGLLRRASALRRRYGDMATTPQSTWSLVNRAATRFTGRAVPEARDRDHFYAQWTRAMCSVLNDLRRRGTVRAARVPLDSAWAEREQDEPAVVEALREALEALAAQDERVQERKALILALRHFEGLSWKDVARHLGTTVPAVRREWYLAQAWLRRELRRRGVDLDRAP